MFEEIQIQQIWLTQRCLRRWGQIQELIDLVSSNKTCKVPKIVLHRCRDGEIVLHDGHHRLTAMWLSGRKVLQPEEYVLFEFDSKKNRMGKIKEFLKIALPNGLPHVGRAPSSTAL